MSIDVNVQNDLVIVTESSEDIVVNVSNAAGPQGPAGAAGQGVPVGGTTGQVLKKFTNTNYDTYWAADASGLTSVGLSVPTGLTVSNSPLTTNGTIAVGLASGYSIPTTASQATWNTAYNDSIVSAGVTGTTTKTLTLNQQDGGTVTASWTDDNTDAVTSVFGRTGAVIAAEGDYTLTQLGDVTLTSPTNGQVLKYNGTAWVNNTDTDTGLTSVGLSMPAAFSVANTPLTSNGTLAVTAAGTSAQYIRGDGQLANFPANGGGGSAYNYYLNGSVNQGTFGGDTYYEMSKTPVLGAGTNFTRTNAQGNGYIASFITDAGDPSLLNIPGGNWNLEFYFQSSASGGSPQFYAELYKVSAANVFTLVASGSTNPEGITNGTTVDQYFTSIPVPQTSLLVTDRLAIRIYVITSGRTITLHTEDGNLCEVLTTFSTGLNALNGLTAQVQYFATGTSGTDFAISSATDTHTFNLPTASATNRGALSSADWSTFSGKVGGSGATGQVAYWNGTNSQTGSNNLFWDAANARLGIGTNTPSRKLHVIGTSALFQNAGEFELDLLNTTSGNYLRLVASTADSYLGTIQNIPFSFIMNGSRVGQFTSTNGNLILQNGGTFIDGGERLQVNGTAKITGNTLISAGNLSIFTTNTPRRLNLQVANGSKAAAIGIEAGGVIHSVIGADTTGNDFLQVASRAGISFYSGSTIGNIVTDPTNERMRLTTAGRLLLGLTTESTFLLDVNGTSRIKSSTNGVYDGLVILTPNLLATTNYGYGGIQVNVNTYTISSTISNLNINLSGQTNITATTNNFFDGLKVTSNNTAASLNIGYAGIQTNTNDFFLAKTSGEISVGINTQTSVASAVLHASSTTKGFLPPRMTTTQRTGISSPATGLFLYDTTDNEYEYYNGTAWTALQSKLTNPVTGTGTTNYLPKWTSSSALGNSLVYDNGTNVLINTTSDSGQKLQVNGTIKADGRIFINAGNGNQLYLNNAGERYTQITFDNNSTSITQAYLAWDSVANFFEMYAKTGGGLKFYANQSEAMIITTSSFVGIGTSTPSYKLDVNRSSLGTIAQFITLDGTYNPRLLISGTAEGIQLFATYSSGGAEALMFGTANSEKMRLTSNLLIGGTVDSGERLQVTGSAKITGDVNISGVFRETVTTNRQTASYTLALTDNGKLVEMNVATANNLTVPLNSSIAFPIGTKIDLSQYGAGQTTIVATSGVTVRSAGGALKLAVQYSGGSLVKIGTDEWYLFGDITV